MSYETLGGVSRRSFLIGLFGTAAVVPAGSIPAVIEALPEKDFISAIMAARPHDNEVYGNGTDYAFAKIEYLNEAPWFKISVPDGYRPLRAESDRIADEVMARMMNS